jgi:capsid protein
MSFYIHLKPFALGWDAGDSNRMRKDLGWNKATPRDEDSNLSDGTLETIRQKAIDMRRNNPIIAGVCDRFASWAVGTGINPQARTSSKEWNKAAEAFWQPWSLSCDIRQRASLWRLQWQAVSLRPTHGGMYFELLNNGQIRPIECERIRQPQNAADAKFYTDGVRVDPETGLTLSYCVHSRSPDGTFGGKHAERIVRREDMVPVVTPEWRPDQVRGVPDLAPMVPVIQDIHDANNYQLNTFKVQSMIIGMMKKLGGSGSNSLPRGTTSPTPGKRQTFNTEWGQILEGFPGEDIDLKVSPTPGAQHIPYIKLQLSLAAAALDVPYEWFTLDFSTADLSRQRAILTLVNKTMRNWRGWINESMNQRLWNWRIAKAIKNGELPPAPTEKRNGFDISEWWKVDWQAPEEVNTDRQESVQADMIEWQLGLGPLSKAARRRGNEIEDLLRQKADVLKTASEIETEYGLKPGTLIVAQIPGQTGNQSVPPPPKGMDNGNQ